MLWYTYIVNFIKKVLSLLGLNKKKDDEPKKKSILKSCEIESITFEK